MAGHTASILRTPGGNRMRIALKEWAVVIDALARGRQVFLLRKGGIAEGRDGFELLHREWLFYPTWEHQQADLIRPEFKEDFERGKMPSGNVVPLECLGKAAGVRPAPNSLAAFSSMEADHIWNERFLRMRYEYRPDLPLYMVFVRTYRLARPAEVAYDPRYAGCRSWVDLNEEIDARGAQPVLTDGEFERAMEALSRAADGHGT